MSIRRSRSGQLDGRTGARFECAQGVSENAPQRTHARARLALLAQHTCRRLLVHCTRISMQVWRVELVASKHCEHHSCSHRLRTGESASGTKRTSERGTERLPDVAILDLRRVMSLLRVLEVEARASSGRRLVASGRARTVGAQLLPDRDRCCRRRVGLAVRVLLRVSRCRCRRAVLLRASAHRRTRGGGAGGRVGGRRERGGMQALNGRDNALENGELVERHRRERALRLGEALGDALRQFE